VTARQAREIAVPRTTESAASEEPACPSCLGRGGCLTEYIGPRGVKAVLPLLWRTTRTQDAGFCRWTYSVPASCPWSGPTVNSNPASDNCARRDSCPGPDRLEGVRELASSGGRDILPVSRRAILALPGRALVPVILTGRMPVPLCQHPPSGPSTSQRFSWEIQASSVWRAVAASDRSMSPAGVTGSSVAAGARGRRSALQTPATRESPPPLGSYQSGGSRRPARRRRSRALSARPAGRTGR
jgi:hypothetical protein